MQEVNVRVAVRVRPLLPKEKLAGEQMCVRLIPQHNQLVLGKDRAFTFDSVLSSKTNQDEVYADSVEPLVKSCFEGYNATVFAYGQTGSGKTYTMGGGNIASLTEEEYGIIPRAIKQMFEIIQANHNKEYTVKVSYIEIYREELRDLLDLETSSKDLHIREDEHANTVITGTNELKCETVDEVMSCLETGSAYRHTGSTQMNEYSSRSHSIFTVIIEQRWADGFTPTGRTRKPSEDSEVIDDIDEICHFMSAKFHFVDLAGSERAHRTGNVGDRFKESVHINSGLLALGNVISALGDPKKKAAHIPYRDSKITRLLKDSLGGNAQTLMVCCISPSSANFDESLNALKYANRARNIRNKPVVNRDPQSLRFEEMQSEILALREELHRQRTSMLSSRTNDTEHGIDVSQIKQLEDKVIQLQTECAHYRMIGDDAYKQLLDIQTRDILSQSQNVRLRDWLDLMEELKNKVPSTLNRTEWENQTIVKLEHDLKKARDDLKSDEEIFAEKSRDIQKLQNRVSELEGDNDDKAHQIEELQERIRQQDEQLVQQQMEIQEVNARLKERLMSVEIEEPLSPDIEEELDLPSTRRAKSVPAHMLDRPTKMDTLEPQPRNIHTSPALISLDRVMQGFRARSQLLINRLEDNDEVLQAQFSDGSDEEGNDDLENNNTDKLKNKHMSRNDSRRGTFKVKRPKFGDNKSALHQSHTDDEKMILRGSVTDLEKSVNKAATRGALHSAMIVRNDSELNQSADEEQLRSSTALQLKELKHTQLRLQENSKKMKELAINIRMKEQLIKELVKTGKDAQQMNKTYESKIKGLETDRQQAMNEMSQLQKALGELEVKKEQQETAEKQKLQNDFRKKLELAKMKMHTLQKKQRETEKMVTLTGANEKRIQELETAVDKMRQQQETLQRKLKEESERKSKLERNMQKDQQRIRELEIRTEQQKKVLKIKTEEVAAAQRRLRSGNSSTSSAHSQRRLLSRSTVPHLPSLRLHQRSRSEEQNKLGEKQRWLDAEVEKVLQQRKHMDELQKELQQKEDIIAKKEAILAEKNELEFKKLRSSQVLNKDMLMVSSKLESVEKKLEEKSREMQRSSDEQRTKVTSEVKSLQQGRDRLKKQHNVLDVKLSDGNILSPQEERRLIELEEAIDALDAAIEYKNDAISDREQELHLMARMSEDHLMARLNTLSSPEIKTLFSKYFEKVIDLRESERKKTHYCSELEMRLDEQEQLLRDLEGTLQHAAMETDRKLTTQQQEYEKKIQILLRQIAEGKDDPTTDTRLQQLEKDLYYYKKTSRDLKKKLREIMAGGSTGADGDKGEEVDVSASSTRDLPPISPKPNTPSYSRHSRETDAFMSSALAGPDWNPQRHLGVSGSRTNITPVKISRKDLKRISDDELAIRMSNVNHSNASLIQDSLDVSRNQPGH